MPALSRVLAKLRKRRDLTQAELSSRSGVDPTHIYRIENGDKDMTRRVLQQIAIGLDLNPEEIVDLVLAKREAPLTRG